MRKNRFEFTALFTFLLALSLVVANGFTNRIAAQGSKTDVWKQIEPIGVVLDEILRNYVKEPDTQKVVEGALIGMLNSLDDHSSYISADMLKQMREDTEGEFEGIGVSIHLDDAKNLEVLQPILGSPAAEAGIRSGDIIYKIDGVSTKGIGVAEAAQRIKGPGGTMVHLTIIRHFEDPQKEPEILELDIKRGKVPLVSIMESRVLDGGIGYIRVSDFKATTAKEISEKLKELSAKGMKSLVLDLRYNPGGLLTASKEVCSLFLPKGTLVTYTKGRENGSTISESLRLTTDRNPDLPATFPIVLLVSQDTASSAEIVTGALQYWQRAIVVGVKTFGKGSVQTIIPLHKPDGAALRLTTALYYTPAQVTINKEGIKPDVEAPMSRDDQQKLLKQMRASLTADPNNRDLQNHGTVTGNAIGPDGVEDVQLQKAVEILREDTVFQNLIQRHHKDTSLTQVAATASESSDGEASPGTPPAEAPDKDVP
ncbi:MAG TPA: S41 family peptidase [Candidatus Hydrogenedentes bacterium]|nr:S41 family peptidase [Candidatus Hydrogenedentota bacterium]